jgi:hypothetical protein
MKRQPEYPPFTWWWFFETALELAIIAFIIFATMAQVIGG